MIFADSMSKLQASMLKRARDGRLYFEEQLGDALVHVLQNNTRLGAKPEKELGSYSLVIISISYVFGLDRCWLFLPLYRTLDVWVPGARLPS